ncbi:hypothetical protein TL16_g12907 [Triparma laevis f. inornata]|uniref:Uncharacterized protein n=2 Tax=Triparma laevis TaxID=1534972 RepID=A0A9W7ACR8_9STRA|nr:hypothetical protein TrLO_g8830 [Triparma laevis f. longispina]GMH94438.1 hypothetical protein TL16_g12907 [Triparma laevis f. inornata]
MKQLHQYIYPQCSCAWSRIAIWSRQNTALLYDADLDSIVGENALAYKANPKSQSGKKNLYVRSRILGFSQMGRELSGEEDFWTNTLGFQLYQDKYPGWEGYDEEQYGYKHNTDAITAVAYRAAAQYKYDDEPEKRLFFGTLRISRSSPPLRAAFGMTRFYNLGYLRDLVKRAEEAGKKINRSYFNEKKDQKVDCEWLPRAILEMCEGLDDLVDLPHVNRIVGKHSCYECVDPQTGKKHVWNEFQGP